MLVTINVFFCVKPVQYNEFLLSIVDTDDLVLQWPQCCVCAHAFPVVYGLTAARVSKMCSSKCVTPVDTCFAWLEKESDFPSSCICDGILFNRILQWLTSVPGEQEIIPSTIILCFSISVYPRIPSKLHVISLSQFLTYLHVLWENSFCCRPHIY